MPPSPSPLLAVALLLAAAPTLAQRIDVERILVRGALGRTERSPVVRDPIEAAFARETFTAPKNGVDGWRALTQVDGRFRDPALAGGYAFATVDSPRDQILLLNARGHRTVRVNGTMRTGDPYDLGTFALPVALRHGTNELLFRTGRASFAVSLEPPPADVFVDASDPTLPEPILDEPGPWLGAVPIVNATNEWQRDLVAVVSADGKSRRTPLPPLPPLSRRKPAFTLPDLPRVAGARAIRVAVFRGDRELHATDVPLHVRTAAERHVRTFRSDVDGSIQHYAVGPAAPPANGTAAAPPGLLLTLHGAGVEARSQVAAYAAKDWAHVVAPTNRRPFGFDWEDIGRLDALEVLADAQRRLPHDPSRRWLTGHSMGGHGTWLIGAQFPDRFAAIAPAAGWRDFWSYSGGARIPAGDPLQGILERATNVSRPLLLKDNYRQVGVFVLHGDADETVSVREARAMRAELGQFHPDFAYQERAGGSHWWGNDAVDWPPLMEFLRRRALPDAAQVASLTFVTVDPGVSAHCHWLTIHAQRQALLPSRVEATRDVAGHRLRLTTANVLRLRVEWPDAGAVAVTVDGETLAGVRPIDGALWLARDDDGAWSTTPTPAAALKSPERAGPFKSVFRRRMLFVHGTRGDAVENAWSFERARLDAETLGYRANADVDIATDIDAPALLAADPDRNVVLYGNASTNGAFAVVLDAGPIELTRERLRIGDREIVGDDLACMFVRPRRGSDVATVAVIGGTGLPGCRTTDVVPTFVSGAGFPDWIALQTTVLERGYEALVGAGFFADDWSLGPDHVVRKTP